MEKQTKFHCPVEGCSFSEAKGKHFKKKLSVDQHYLNCHSEKKFKCFNCEKGFAIDWQLKYHQKNCGLIWRCLTCDKYYKERLSLLTHCTRHSHVLPEEAKRRRKSKKKDQEHKNNSSSEVTIFPVTLPIANEPFILPKPEILFQMGAPSTHQNPNNPNQRPVHR